MQVGGIQQVHCSYGFFTHLYPGERVEDGGFL